jgi:hypothetical protein
MLQKQQHGAKVALLGHFVKIIFVAESSVE